MKNIKLSPENGFHSYSNETKIVNQWKIFLLFILLLFTGCQIKPEQQGNKNILGMKKIEVGDTIPDIILKDQNGNLYNIKSESKGKNVVLYFYPKDDTRGCTAEACTFRDQFKDFIDAKATVIGISGQSVESHKKFAEKNNLPFTLLSDKGNKVRKMFGVPTNLFGLLPGRVTYVINKDHRVVYIYNSQTKIQDHIDNSLTILRNSE